MLSDRVWFFDTLFDKVTETSSYNEKRYLLESVPKEYADDLTYILEILDGKHKLGYTFQDYKMPQTRITDNCTIREYLAPLYEPMKSNNFTMMNVMSACVQCSEHAWFVEPIVNRTIKLGIGKSVLQKSEIAPMLAKKYEGKVPQQFHGYFVTEKLDGNRCIAYYNDGKWSFVSRNGKPLKVNFDMNGLDTDFVYDGEILSYEQTKSSVLLNSDINSVAYDKNLFNATSGRINAKYGEKNLVYNIFDIQLDLPYYQRREILNNLGANVKSKDVRILPVFMQFKLLTDFRTYIDQLLDNVTSRGAEGLMINLGDAPYCNKRTDQLLKYKNVYTLDMEVLDVQDGKGKYEGCIGALNCRAVSDGKIIECEVGSGMTDEQRISWALNPKDIIGKIIEVSYFSMSQSANTNGTKYYSLRFPRMTGIRSDKGETSVY
jgi:DNA ligase-1